MESELYYPQLASAPLSMPIWKANPLRQRNMLSWVTSRKKYKNGWLLISVDVLDIRGAFNNDTLKCRISQDKEEIETVEYLLCHRQNSLQCKTHSQHRAWNNSRRFKLLKTTQWTINSRLFFNYHIIYPISSLLRFPLFPNYDEQTGYPNTTAHPLTQLKLH